MTEFTELDFDRISPSFFFVDKKAGLKVALGSLGNLESRWSALWDKHGGAMIAVLANGMGQDRLDKACRDLEADCSKEGVEVVITKSRHHFDKQWYIFGDLNALLEAAARERVKLPFSRLLADDLKQQLKRTGEQA